MSSRWISTVGAPPPEWDGAKVQQLAQVGDPLLKMRRLGLEEVGGLGRFLGGTGVFLGDLVHLQDGVADLVDALVLLAG